MFKTTLGCKITRVSKITWVLATLFGLAVVTLFEVATVGVATVGVALAQPAGAQLPPRSSQWDRSPKTMYDLVAEGFELKATRNNHGLVALAPGVTRPLTYYHLQKGPALALCIEDLGTNLGNRAAPVAPSFACYMLTRPAPPPAK